MSPELAKNTVLLEANYAMFHLNNEIVYCPMIMKECYKLWDVLK